ncbi:hypothetical protein [Flavobacterium album]|nr:hypothetical protein [Flavobacterium album]
MKDGKLYYLWLYLPDKIKLPPYSRTKKRREEIYNKVIDSLQAGEAKLYQAGLDNPDEKVQKSNEEVSKLHLFTSVVLKYYTTMKIDFSLPDNSLIDLFARLMKGSEDVIIIGDNTRMLIDTDKYRRVTLEGRKKWLTAD